MRSRLSQGPSPCGTDKSPLAMGRREDGILIRTAIALPAERYTPERKAELLPSTATTAKDYQRPQKEVKNLGLDPATIPHRRAPVDGRPASDRQNSFLRSEPLCEPPSAEAPSLLLGSLCIVTQDHCLLSVEKEPEDHGESRSCVCTVAGRTEPDPEATRPVGRGHFGSPGIDCRSFRDGPGFEAESPPETLCRRAEEDFGSAEGPLGQDQETESVCLEATGTCGRVGSDGRNCVRKQNRRSSASAW
jgi:hypothetical protein